ncbi:MAG: hypothetical protein ACR2PF_20430 [Rhizobiaceae bacterium]
MAGNVVVCGLIGLAVDTCGATLDHCSNPVVIGLLRNGEAGPEIIPAAAVKRKRRTVPTS